MSLVLEYTPAAPEEAFQHYAAKLSVETDVSDVYADMQAGSARFVLADVRSAEDYANGHAAGALSLPHRTIREEAMQIFPRSTLFVVYCWGPGCNGADKAAFKLSALGYRVKIMIGGYEYWAREYPVATGEDTHG